MICDDQLFVKPTPQGEGAFPRLPKAPPYEGAKDYLLAEDVDDREGLTRLVRVTVRPCGPNQSGKGGNDYAV